MLTNTGAPMGVRTTICSECREDWVEHVRLAESRAVEAAIDHGDHQVLSRDEQNHIRANAVVTFRECVSLLLKANAGPPGPQGAMGMPGAPGRDA